MGIYEDAWRISMTREVASRRTKTGKRRDHRVGPLRLNDDELRTVQLAADNVGLSLGAYATDVVVRAAHAELDGLRIESGRLEELRSLQLTLAQLEVDLNPTHYGDPSAQLAKMVAGLLEALQRSCRSRR
jgi:hypothetical protein